MSTSTQFKFCFGKYPVNVAWPFGGENFFFFEAELFGIGTDPRF
jgi:hypothetical protein